MEARLSVAVRALSAWPDRLRGLVREGITLWEADLDELAAASRLRVSAAERAQAARIECRHERARWLTSRRLRNEVVAWSGARRAEGLHYSTARRGARWLLALGPCELGIDIERVEGERAEVHARRIFTARELRVWQRRQALGRERMFFATWTAKEAVAKALGRDRAIPPSAIELPPFARHWRRLPAPAAARVWWLRQLQADAGYAAALCAGEPLRMVARVRLCSGDIDIAA